MVTVRNEKACRAVGAPDLPDSDYVRGAARTSTQASRDCGTGQDMADVYCASARNRLTGLWRQLTVNTEPG